MSDKEHLWKVTLEFTVLVLASTERKAARLAEALIDSGVGDVDAMDSTEVTSLNELPSGWENALPFGPGYDDQRTCRQILEGE